MPLPRTQPYPTAKRNGRSLLSQEELLDPGLTPRLTPRKACLREGLEVDKESVYRPRTLYSSVGSPIATIATRLGRVTYGFLSSTACSPSHVAISQASLPIRSNPSGVSFVSKRVRSIASFASEHRSH